MQHWHLCHSTSYKSICSLCWLKSNFYTILYQLLHSRLRVASSRFHALSYQVFWEKGRSLRLHLNCSQIREKQMSFLKGLNATIRTTQSNVVCSWSKIIGFRGLSFHFPFKKRVHYLIFPHALLLLIPKSVPFHCSCPGCSLCDSVGGFFRLRPCSGV